MNYMSNITYLNNGYSFWDQTLLHDLLKDYDGERHVVVVPGAINNPNEVNDKIKDFSKVLVIITSDEENKFPVSELYHTDIKIFITYPDVEKHRSVDGYLPIGYCPNTRKLVKQNGMSAKSLDWFFAGQVNHASRQECADKLMHLEGGKLVTSQGFAQGLEYKEYMQYMCRAKVAPCPEGNVSPDSFRLYEALEAGCIPIVRNKTFWEMLFGEVPFPVVDDWGELPELINHYKDRSDVSNKCQAWWLLKKRELRCTLLES